jgi:membrane protease YdiL (CAAX protease family)
MTDLEPTRPPEHEPPSGPRFPTFELSRYITFGIAIVLGATFLCLPVPRTPATRINELEDPVRVVVRTFERDLEIDSAVSTDHAWLRRALEIVMNWSNAPLIEASDAYRDVYLARMAELAPPVSGSTVETAGAISGPTPSSSDSISTQQPSPSDSTSTQQPTPSDSSSAQEPSASESRSIYGPEDSDASLAESSTIPAAGDARVPTVRDEQLAEIAMLRDLQVRRAILLAEAGSADEADRALQLVEDAEPALCDLVRRAYGERERNVTPAVDQDAARLNPGWVRTRLELRLAERRGDTHLVDQMREVDAERGGVLRRRATFLALLYCVPCILGLVILCAWLLRDRPEITIGTVAIPPPWSWERGFAILVRSAFAGLAISMLLLIAGSSLELEFVSAWTTLVASIPMMWWIRHYLAMPGKISLSHMLGLVPSGRDVFASIGLALAVIAVDQLGSSVISVALSAAGIDAHWAEFAQEHFVFGSTPYAAMRFVDAAVWAPIFEEIGCRGLLYLTIRRRLGPGGAAIVSAALFGAVHLYSLPGLLSVCWSGVVYAVAVERTRSLWPAMAAHAFNNACVLSGAWLFYR